MKKTLILLFAALVAVTASAKQEEKESISLYSCHPTRTQIVLPQVDGFNAYKADFHVHTFFSDAEVSPEERVEEAWYDGLDILAITDHIETRRQERAMLKFLKNYSPDKKGFEPINTRCSRGVPADERGIISDLNYSVEAAKAKAKSSYPDLFIIKGTEISREPEKIGHYCALFTKDNNTLYVTDDAQTIRNAKAQGAIIIHNHPGWERASTTKTEFEKGIYTEGLIDGAEVTNGSTFYMNILERCVAEKLFVVSATDIHRRSITQQSGGFYRPMTIVFAKEKSEEAIREALLSRRTLGYCGGNIIGEVSMLEKFFKASITAKLASESSKGKRIVLKNNSSIPYNLTLNGAPVRIEALSEVVITVKDKVVVTVQNMIHKSIQHPTFELNIN